MRVHGDTDRRSSPAPDLSEHEQPGIVAPAPKPPTTPAEPGAPLPVPDHRTPPMRRRPRWASMSSTGATGSSSSPGSASAPATSTASSIAASQSPSRTITIWPSRTCLIRRRITISRNRRPVIPRTAGAESCDTLTGATASIGRVRLRCFGARSTLMTVSLRVRPGLVHRVFRVSAVHQYHRRPPRRPRSWRSP